MSNILLLLLPLPLPRHGMVPVMTLMPLGFGRLITVINSAGRSETTGHMLVHDFQHSTRQA
ncbi:MAG: hypothetical protein ABWY06_02650 [Pseudomonas sp.]|uniref:hypothetical protein n=1 Tax=Pseudomonas sp. TaxID=306 RepID=UPI00339729FB